MTLSVESLRVILGIGEKTDWHGVVIALSVFSFQTYVCLVRASNAFFLLLEQWSTVFQNYLPKAQRQDQVFNDVGDKRSESTEPS